MNSAVAKYIPFTIIYVSLIVFFTNYLLLGPLKFTDKIPEDKIIEYIYQGIKGLEYLKSKNSSHNDIKPDNILFCNGVLKFCDFGLIKIKD